MSAVVPIPGGFMCVRFRPGSGDLWHAVGPEGESENVAIFPASSQTSGPRLDQDKFVPLAW
jgi:hypothetical protein